jgi:hypothetical protein
VSHSTTTTLAPGHPIPYQGFNVLAPEDPGNHELNDFNGALVTSLVGSRIQFEGAPSLTQHVTAQVMIPTRAPIVSGPRRLPSHNELPKNFFTKWRWW